jgi:hypothetical protein
VVVQKSWWKGLHRFFIALAVLSLVGTALSPIALAATPTIAEASTPPVIQALRRKLDRYQPQVTILSPKAGETFQDTTASLKFAVKDLPIYKDAKLGLGPHLHVFLDEDNYQAVYDLSQPLVLKDLKPGTHTIRVFASRPWHESFKNDGAFAQVTFNVFTATKDDQPNPDLPLLTYSRPQGSYGAEPIMLDYYLTNAPLHLVANDDKEVRDWRVKATIDGTSFILDKWQPIYLKGLPTGQNWAQLEFVDAKGESIPNVFNNTVKLFDYQPGGDDSLAKLVRGELTAAEAMGIVDPNYKPAEKPVAPTAAPVVKATPAIESKSGSGIPVVPIPVPVETPKPAKVEVKPAVKAPEPVKAVVKPEVKPAVKPEVNAPAKPIEKPIVEPAKPSMAKPAAAAAAAAAAAKIILPKLTAPPAAKPVVPAIPKPEAAANPLGDFFKRFKSDGAAKSAPPAIERKQPEATKPIVKIPAKPVVPAKPAVKTPEVKVPTVKPTVKAVAPTKPVVPTLPAVKIPVAKPVVPVKPAVQAPMVPAKPVAPKVTAPPKPATPVKVPEIKKPEIKVPEVKKPATIKPIVPPKALAKPMAPKVAAPESSPLNDFLNRFKAAPEKAMPPVNAVTPAKPAAPKPAAVKPAPQNTTVPTNRFPAKPAIPVAPKPAVKPEVKPEAKPASGQFDYLKQYLNKPATAKSITTKPAAQPLPSQSAKPQPANAIRPKSTTKIANPASPAVVAPQPAKPTPQPAKPTTPPSPKSTKPNPEEKSVLDNLELPKDVRSLIDRLPMPKDKSDELIPIGKLLGK